MRNDPRGFGRPNNSVRRRRGLSRQRGPRAGRGPRRIRPPDRHAARALLRSIWAAAAAMSSFCWRRWSRKVAAYDLSEDDGRRWCARKRSGAASPISTRARARPSVCPGPTPLSTSLRAATARTIGATFRRACGGAARAEAGRTCRVHGCLRRRPTAARHLAAVAWSCCAIPRMCAIIRWTNGAHAGRRRASRPGGVPRYRLRLDSCPGSRG